MMDSETTINSHPYSRKTCWCGERATRECDYIGSKFVCGAPLCEFHECCLTGLFGPHSERGRNQWDKYCERWRARKWSELLTTKKPTRKTEFIGIEHGLEWARESKHICGFSLSFDLPQNRWKFTLGADPCGLLKTPESQASYYCSQASSSCCPASPIFRATSFPSW